MYNQVQVKLTDPQELVLATRSESDTFFCIADSSTPGTDRGKVDAATFAACTGGW